MIKCTLIFILLWQYERPVAFEHMPRHACVMPNPTGGYVCNKEGCKRL